MNPGRLRHRVTFDQPVVGQSSSGAQTITFTPYCDVWASVEPLRGKETLQAGQVAADMDTRIRVRWSSETDCITPKWRARFNGIIYDIKQVSQVAFANREIELMCQSGLNQG